jgi:hypothetical protein
METVESKSESENPKTVKNEEPGKESREELKRRLRTKLSNFSRNRTGTSGSIGNSWKNRIDPEQDPHDIASAFHSLPKGVDPNQMPLVLSGITGSISACFDGVSDETREEMLSAFKNELRSLCEISAARFKSGIQQAMMKLVTSASKLRDQDKEIADEAELTEESCVNIDTEEFGSDDDEE